MCVLSSLSTAIVGEKNNQPFGHFLVESNVSIWFKSQLPSFKQIEMQYRPQGGGEQISKSSLSQ